MASINAGLQQEHNTITVKTKIKKTMQSVLLEI